MILGPFWGFTGFMITVLAIIGMWKLFEKANEPGWAAIIPIYNMWIMAKIAGINPVMIFAYYPIGKCYIWLLPSL